MTLKWSRLYPITQLSSPWVTICCERWQNEQGIELDYWRVEKANSVIILPVWRHFILLPQPNFRVGINQLTDDFPGGRVLPGKTLQESAVEVLQRELGIIAEVITKINLLNQDGWIINSSFSNQKLYAFSIEINPNYFVIPEKVSGYFRNNEAGITALLKRLGCLQCRAVLLEWLTNQLLIE
ncbi:MAG: NUDIX hydrolase [Thioploca sp.]|nr:NUDIX hydrolase [Thioploca sp.]